jgi:AcrR family transcriptional regulator
VTRLAELSSGIASRDGLLQAALQAFFEQGFHGTSMRTIATLAGTAISHAYYYFPAKSDLLKVLIFQVTEDLITDLERAEKQAGEDPAARLYAIVRSHVLLHTQRQAEAFVGNTELRSLKPEDRAQAITLRDDVTAIFKRAVADGVECGTFHCPHPAEAVLAMTTMCTAVAVWYRAGGSETPKIIAERYAALALKMVGAQS